MEESTGGEGGAGPSGTGGGGFEFGVDPSMDPELAMVSAFTYLCVEEASMLM